MVLPTEEVAGTEVVVVGPKNRLAATPRATKTRIRKRRPLNADKNPCLL